MRIHYVVEDEPLGRGGGLKKAMRALGPDYSGPVIAANGDILTNIDLNQMIRHHEDKNALATILLTPFFSQYGVVDVDEEDHVLGFREKPELPYWVNAGVYVFEREIVDLLPDKGDHEDSTFPRLTRERRFAAFRSRALWRGVDTVKDLSEISKEMERRLFESFVGNGSSNGG
jgi:NDP-sugar pyrophosphorylase family protein